MSEVKTIAQRVREVVALAMGLMIVTDEATASDLEMDSLDRMEVLMSIEDEFSIEISDTDAEKLLNQPVREWVQYVSARLVAKA
jgi:acyl carrier protein